MADSNPKIPWGFLFVSFLLSWAVWIPVANTGIDYQSSPYLLAAVLVGAFGPGLAAILFNYFSGDIGQINDFRQRIYDFRRIRPGWILIILALWPALHGLSIGITKLVGNQIPESPFLKEILQQPATIPVVLFLYFIQAALEELGWRGFLQEKLTDPFGPGSSSLMVGLIHAIWHLPLFWVVGTNQIKMGFGVDFWIFIIFVVATSVISAWCYLGNGRSILAAALLHTTGNLSFDIFSYAPGTIKHLIFVLLMVLGAIGILIYFRLKWKKTPT
jgi:membrane protease YdiL (CAAX protease family)